MTTIRKLTQVSDDNATAMKLGSWVLGLALFVASMGTWQTASAAQCDGTITANVVAIDNPTVFNRLGAQNPNWMMYALERDVVHWDDGNPLDSNNGKPCSEITGGCIAGQVQLRPDKRPRPIVVRSVEGACLTINFTNLLDPRANPNNPQLNTENPAFPVIDGRQPGEDAVDCTAFPDDRRCVLNNNDQVAGRCAGFHATGTELVASMADDGSMVGLNGVGKTIPGSEDPTTGIALDAASVGPTDAGQKNCGEGMAAPGETRTYNLYTPHEGAYIINSYGATIGSEASGGNLGIGLFGGLNVQPKGARLYRSQVTEEELRLATTGFTADGQPIIDYDVLYPNEQPWIDEGKAGLPVLRMVTDASGRSGELVHTDINAIIAGPDADGSWRNACAGGSQGSPAENCPYPLESVGKNNPQLPNRIEAFREFSSIYHDEQTNSQVFPKWYGDPVLGYTLDGVGDAFMINYGSGGIGSEIIANRLHVGPMHDCTDCAYEEFFLASQTVGDPALLVQYPANTLIEACDPKEIVVFETVPSGVADDPTTPDVDESVKQVPSANQPCWRQVTATNPDTGEVLTDADGNPVLVGANPPIANNEALYQEDPSNVHHAYVGDYTKVRNIHAGAFEQHIFHLHNQQWLFNPNDDNANYLDAQEIMPGSGHTYELVNGGSGNRNKTSGDAIYHCHFYPHFAQGMWYHIRILDTFQRGTVLAVSNANTDEAKRVDTQNPPKFDSLNPDKGIHVNRWDLRSGRPAEGSRALPDGELPDGSPIPAIVPLPGKAMPPMPAKVSVAAVDRGDFGVLSGRRPPNGLFQGPDSSQAVIDLLSMAGGDRKLGTDDDVSPGFPFHLAGNSCGFLKDADGNLPTDAYGKLLPNVTVEDVEFDANNCLEGTVGQRMMTPVLDMLTEEGAKDITMPDEWANLGGGWDGGLPRHNLRGYTSGGLSLDTQNRLDFRKIIKSAAPVYYPETGTESEKVAMAFHAVRFHPSEANLLGKVNGDGSITPKPKDKTKTGVNFLLNGSAPVPGGPFQDPCVDDEGHFAKSGEVHDWYDGNGHTGDPDTKGNNLGTKGGSPYGADNPRTYKLANVQIDAVFNKVGHHYSQERIIALWGDVLPLINKERPPEPLVMRFNTFDCGKILHANLVPAEFEVDDFQVRTPTDIIGQHIHLPKWDLTTNDGAANGWNYEDGSLAPLMVQERIKAINNYNALAGSNLPLTEILTGPAPLLELTPGVDFHADLVGALAGHMVDLRDLAPVPTIPTGDPHIDAQRAGDDPYVLTARAHPFFGKGELINDHYEYKGARTTIQRILVDPVMNVAGVDRGLGLTFSHDHYGPSTFQQIGLYSTILAEPAGSNWYHNESRVKLGDRVVTGPGGQTTADGGPTTWQAAIITGENTDYNVVGTGCDLEGNTCVDGVGGAGVPAHREFYFEMSDFQHAYNAGVYVAADEFGRPKEAEFGNKIKQIYEIRQPNYFNATEAYADTINGTWADVVNPTLKVEAHKFPDVVTAKGACPGPAGNWDTTVPRPCAEAINLGHSSTWVINYRNEPLGLRVFDPDGTGPDGKVGAQSKGRAGDLALAFSSSIQREIPDLNTRFGSTPLKYRDEATYCSSEGDEINCDRGVGDPFTPIMRAHEGDQVKVKIQVGATEEQHQTTIHGIKWLSNGSGFGRSPNSGWRNFQSHGISEQFSLQAPMNPALRQAGQTVDYLYATDATRPGMWLGTWGILRTYGNKQGDLYPLPNNDMEKNVQFVNQRDFDGVCPKSATVKSFDISAVLANNVLPNNLGVTIPSNAGQDSDGDGTGDNAGGPLNTGGGTLVYNRRGTVVPTLSAVESGGSGPLNDPTAMMYVMTDDLIPKVEYEALVEGKYPSCVKKKGGKGGGSANFDATLSGCAQEADLEGKGCLINGAYKPDLATCAAILRPDAPVEPLVIRANAGECIEVQLRNRLVTRQAVTKDTGEKVFWSDGKPAMHWDDKSSVSYHRGSGSGPQVHRDDIEFFLPPDLAGWQDMMWAVTRRLQGEGVNEEMYFFNNNLIAPSGYAGIHPQLVEYDASRDDGLWVGRNQSQLAKPGGASNARYYAGHLEYKRRPDLDKRNTRAVEIVPTAVEFGGSNLLSADRVKQPQKGLFGALVIEPENAVVTEDTMVWDGQGTLDAQRRTRTQVTVDATANPYSGVAGSGGEYRETLAIGHKIGNVRWKDGSAIKNIHQEELGREGAEDSGHAGFNYGMEPSWFRFKLPPNVPFGNAGTPDSFGSIPNPQAMYSNLLVNGEPNSFPNDDPAIPVFTTSAGKATRMYVLNGASADRDGTFILHGHLWQRDPYVCPAESYLGLPGFCNPGSIGSLALGTNPIGKYMGGEEGMGHVYGHWPILFNAGGKHQVQGDFLYRDYTPSGNRNGQFGILRVGDPEQ